MVFSFLSSASCRWGAVGFSEVTVWGRRQNPWAVSSAASRPCCSHRTFPTLSPRGSFCSSICLRNASPSAWTALEGYNELPVEDRVYFHKAVLFFQIISRHVFKNGFTSMFTTFRLEHKVAFAEIILCLPWPQILCKSQLTTLLKAAHVPLEDVIWFQRVTAIRRQMRKKKRMVGNHLGQSKFKPKKILGEELNGTTNVYNILLTKTFILSHISQVSQGLLKWGPIQKRWGPIKVQGDDVYWLCMVS